MAKISKKSVDAATPGERPLFLWDGEVKGFGLLVLPSGVKSFIFQYRTPEGRTRRATIGKYSATLTADQARTRAKAMRRTVEDGGDPLGEKQARREAMTVAQVLSAYLESEKFAGKAASTQSLDRGRIKRHLLPTLGRKYVDQLTAETVRRAFGAIRDGKTAIDVRTGPRGRAIVKGGEGAARMAIRVLRAALNWAVAEGYAASNPAQGVNIGLDGVRKTTLKKDDYPRLFQTLDKMQTERRLRSEVADAVRVIALTGARRNEIASLIWRHVDLKKGIIELPPAAHKTGKTTKESRVIGLPAIAQAIISGQPHGKPDDFVFPPAKGDGPISLSKPWRKIRVEAGLPEGIGLHGLRHSLASAMAKHGAQASEIMTALGHAQLATSQKYIHWEEDERAALAERSAAHITAAMTPTAGGDVVQLTKSKRSR
jgi:integrase